jgi:hypothetical protein
LSLFNIYTVNEESIIEIIQAMLAPGIMISACGLLLLGMNNKYSLVVNRIRVLNIEFRGLQDESSQRHESILTQLPLLIQRMRIIRNAVWLYTIAIAFFIFSILSIGLFLMIQETSIMNYISFGLFILALISLLIGVIHAAREVRLGYDILSIETKNIL